MPRMIKWYFGRQELLFVNKKKQKNFDSFAATHLKPAAHRVNKSFLRRFFSKKRHLL